MDNNVSIKKIQQCPGNHSLELNLPIKFTRLIGLEKGDLVSCKIVDLKNGHNSLIVDKLVVSNSMSTLRKLVELDK